MTRVLLTNPYGPYQMEWDENPYDILGSRLQRGQGPFTLTSTTPCAALYLIAENLNAQTTVLEYPHLEDFEEELRKGYDFVGIQVIAYTIYKVAHMMRRVRAIAPKTKIIIGGYGVLSLHYPPPGETGTDAAYILEQADYLCEEEGVQFVRKVIGDAPADRPVTQWYIPQNTSALPGREAVVDRSSMASMVLVALGCPNGCEFCMTSAMYKKKKIYVMSPRETFEAMKHHVRRNGGRATTVTLMDEDLLLNPKYVRELGKLIQEDTEFGLRKLSYFCFGDLRSMTQYSMEELLELGVDNVWVGVESSLDEVITSEHHIEKRTCDDVKATLDGMAQYGIGATASTVLGWDFHTPENIQDDIDYFVSLAPSTYQVTFLTACPGTPLYKRLAAEGRLDPTMTYHDVQQCHDGNFAAKNFAPGELKQHFDLAHKKLYEANGPGIFRTFEVNLNGYETCSTSRRPLLREQKAGLFAERCRNSYPMLAACAKFAPTETVREKTRAAEEKYRRLFGAPAEDQQMQSAMFCEHIAQRIEDLKTPRTETEFDPPVQWTFYDPARGPVPFVKTGRGGDPPVPLKVFADPEPAGAAV